MPVEKRVFQIVSLTLNVPETEIKSSDKLTDIVSDSIQLFELLIEFEKELGNKVNYDDIANIESVGDIIQYANHIGFRPSII